MNCNEQSSLAKLQIEKMDADRERGDSKRTPEQIAAKKKANTTSNARRSKGGDRSVEQIAAAKAANIDREQGSDRSSKKVSTVKEANKKYYAARPTKRKVQEREEREQFDRWASYKRKSRTPFERLFDDATETLGKHDY